MPGLRVEAILNHSVSDKSQSTLPARSSLRQTRSGSQPRAVRLTRSTGHVRPAPATVVQDEGFRIAIRSTDDIIEARRKGRELAAALDFPSIDRTLIVSAISELARNIVDRAEQGEIRVHTDETLGATGIVITAIDNGPGLPDRRGLQGGTGPAPALGLGLPGVRRIMDEFEIVSRPRQGTTVTVKKWKPQ